VGERKIELGFQFLRYLLKCWRLGGVYTQFFLQATLEFWSDLKLLIF